MLAGKLADVTGPNITERWGVTGADLGASVLAWAEEGHADNKVAQLYGGYVLPASRFGVVGGFGLMVSQWHTRAGWPYRAMQFKASIKDSTIRRRPTDPIIF